ncbi:MAG: DUF1559 domain-containing protein [Fimbriimonadales bacterium]|nr:DUF1559 domain-containing protein [Fimbriimonadales bacterium]
MRRGFTLIELLVVIAIIAILAAILFPVFAQAREAARKTKCLNNGKNWALAIQMYINDYSETFPFAIYDTAVDSQGRRCQFTMISATYPYARNRDILVCPSDDVPMDLHGGILALSGTLQTPGGECTRISKLSYMFNFDLAIPGQHILNTEWNTCPPRRNPVNLAELRFPVETIMMFDAHLMILFNATCGSVLQMDTLEIPIQARHNQMVMANYADGHSKVLRVRRDRPNCVYRYLTGDSLASLRDAQPWCLGEGPYLRRCGRNAPDPCVFQVQGLIDEDAQGKCYRPSRECP